MGPGNSTHRRRDFLERVKRNGQRMRKPRQAGKHETASHSPQKTAARELRESSGWLRGRVLHFNKSFLMSEIGNSTPRHTRRLIRVLLGLRGRLACGALLYQLLLNRKFTVAVILATGPGIRDCQ